MRAAIYARFSTDRQSETSIADQERVCRARAAALGLDVVAVHADHAVSGSTPVDRRRGGAGVLIGAQRRTFDVLLVESLDRLSRDSVDQTQTVRLLEHAGVRVIAADGRYDSQTAARKMMLGMQGIVSEAYVDAIRDKTHRGLVGQLERGFHAGGVPFGYRSVASPERKRDGTPIGYTLEIDEKQADVVREIFARYGAGESCQRIAADLNARGVRGPRGGTWSVAGIYGSPAQHAGLLNNELYIGRQVWNRSHWVKHPVTGVRERQERPESQWIVHVRPQLRVLDDATWRAVRDRMGAKRSDGGRAGRGGMPTTLFGGLLRCGYCGGAVVKTDAKVYSCAARKDRGAVVCSGITVRVDVADRVLVGHLRSLLQDPHLIARLEREAVDRQADASRDAGTAIAAQRRRIADIQAEIVRVTDAIAAIGFSPALGERLKRSEAELEELERVKTRAGVTSLPRAMRERVRALIAGLEGALRDEVPKAREALQAAFGEIKLVPNEGKVYAEFEDAAERLLVAAGGVQIGRVAGAGFEPATFGL
jgi:site-specific DNA recombinase